MLAGLEAPVAGIAKRHHLLCGAAQWLGLHLMLRPQLLVGFFGFLDDCQPAGASDGI